MCNLYKKRENFLTELQVNYQISLEKVLES